MWREIFKNNNITVTYNAEPQISPRADKEGDSLKMGLQEGGTKGGSEAEEHSNPVPHTRGVFQSRDKTTIYYEVYGTGRPLLFCYGLVCRREHWRHQLAHFAQKYQVIMFDYRGHHFSGHPANDQHLTLDWCANDIQDLLNYLKVSEVVGFGHSMGVGVLARAAVQDKMKFKATVFICGTVKNPYEQMFYSNRMNHVHQFASSLFDLMPDTVSNLWQRLTKNNALNFILTSYLGFNAQRSHERDVNSYIEGVNQIPFSVFHSLIDDYTRFDGKTYLAQIDSPALVIAGDKDVITPKSVQDEIVASMPNAEMQVIPEGSHNTHTDFPGEVNLLIDAFLEKIGYR